MFNNYLQSIEGVGIYPIISLLVFFIFFVVMIVWLMRVDKSYIKKMSSMPLDNEENLYKNYSGDNNDNQ